jgi:hypothetical protein
MLSYLERRQGQDILFIELNTVGSIGSAPSGLDAGKRVNGCKISPIIQRSSESITSTKE